MMIFDPELYYQPPIQPDLTADIHISSDELIEKFYEPLRIKYPEYISREEIGFDNSGEYKMWMYDFCPRGYKAAVYLQSGVHPIETEGYLGLARIMTMIADGELKCLRDNVRLIVIPAVSVYGISQKATADQITMNYNIPHNSLKINANRDCYEKRLSETRNVLSVIERYKSELCFGFDLHTTTTTSWGDYLTVYPDELPHRQLVIELNDYLRRKNITWREPNLVYCGSTSNYPTGSNASSFAAYITKELSIPMCTLEHSDLTFDDKLGSSLALTRAVELYLNHIIQALNFYKEGIIK